MKDIIPIKAALGAGLIFTFIGVAADYTVGDAILAVLSLFGCYMVILSLFVYPNIKYRTARIVCGAGLVLLTACGSRALQDLIEKMLTPLLAVLFLISPVVTPVIFVIVLYMISPP